MGNLKEECGVFGIYDLSASEEVASTIYYGLLALQHRGQESCGIAVSDTTAVGCRVSTHKGLGLVNENFTSRTLADLHGNIGVGHVRYATAGGRTIENAQPMVLSYIKGTMALVHNGNIVNALDLRKTLEHDGCIFQSTSDTEIIAYHIARERVNSKTIEEAVGKAADKIHGAYSIILMSPRKLIGMRDPQGFRPLVIGKRDKAWVLASETCALDTIGAEFVRDVEPGEIVTITKNGLKSDRSRCLDEAHRARCIFEYIYFARTDSIVDGVSVYDARIRAGRFLAVDSPVDADIVAGVPASGNAAALGYSIQSGIPYEPVFYKNSYIGRTFISPGQDARETGVKIKLNPIPAAVKGKRVILIDYSIVRGTTSGQIVSMLKEKGAKEVHMMVSSPPFLWPCYFGTDVPERHQLIAYERTVEQIREIIGADSLSYLKIERLPQLVGHSIGICDGCFSGLYPMETPHHDIHYELEQVQDDEGRDEG